MKTMLYDTSKTRVMLRMAEILKTIAHPTRLQILKLLHVHDNLTVTDLQDKLDCGCEQSMLSHHLTKMKDKGILKSNKEGKFIYYSLVDSQIVKLFDCMENCKLL